MNSGIVPSLLVRSMTETLAFYELLGFTVSGCSGDRENADWAEVERNGAVIQFYTEPPTGTPAEPVLSGTLFIGSDNVDAIASQVKGKIEPAWGPEIMEYGMKEFAVQDPNGYFIAFTEPA